MEIKNIHKLSDCCILLRFSYHTLKQQYFLLHISIAVRKEVQISNVGGGTVACNTTGFCVILCWSKAIPTVWTVSKVNCFSVLDSNILEIFSHSYRSPLVPWTHRPRWSGTWLWQHLGVWLWYWNDSANVWKFSTPDRIRLWGQGRRGNTAEMVIKKKQ